MKVRVVMPVGCIVVAALAAGPASHAQSPPPSAPGLVTMVPTTPGDRTTLAIRVTTATGPTASRLNVTGTPEVVVFNDLDGVPLHAGEGCRQLEPDASKPPHRVACPIDKAGGEIARTLAIALGDGDDRLTMKITGPDVTVDGGAGNDNLLAIDQPYPGYGLDESTYPHPKAIIRGGTGNDTLMINGPRFTGSGNEGTDTLRLEGRDGAITGGDGADDLTLAGRGGAAHGGGGNDRLVATAGQDAEINGGPGNDTIKGSPTDDVLVGGFGTDVVLAGAGKDTIVLRDGTADRVFCGADRDVVRADGRALDKVYSCEQVLRPVRRVPN